MGTATNMIQLKDEVLSEIKKSLQYRNALQYGLKISSQTLYRWLETNSINLTTASALNILCKELGRPINELLTEAE